VVWRPRVATIGNRLKEAQQSGWDGDFWHLAYWHKEA
jgi:hypothetical protein